MTKPILKLFWPSGSHIIEAFGTPCTDTKFQGNPSTGAFNTRDVRKIGDFRRMLPFISETVRDRPIIADGYYGTLIGSHECRIEWYNFRWPWVTPNQGFKVTGYLQIEYLKRCVLGTKLLKNTTVIGNHRRSVEWYNFQWPWVTSDPNFKSRHFSTLNISETTRDRAIVTIEHQ